MGKSPGISSALVCRVGANGGVCTVLMMGFKTLAPGAAGFQRQFQRQVRRRGLTPPWGWARIATPVV